MRSRSKSVQGPDALAIAICLCLAGMPATVAFAIPSAVAMPAADNVATLEADSAAMPYGASNTDFGEELFLEVIRNGTKQPGVYRFTHIDGKLYADHQTLNALNIQAVPSIDEQTIALDNLPLSYDYDEATQSVKINVDISALRLPVQSIGAPRNVTRQTDPSLRTIALNYDLYIGKSQVSSINAVGTLGARVSGYLPGAIDSTFVVRNTNNAASVNAIRMDTRWVWNDERRMIGVVLGDTDSLTTSWSRGVHYGGIRFGTRMDLQRDMQRLALPTFSGSAVLPSNVDLYVNGMKQFNGQVAAGPFELNQIPMVNGSGRAQIVVTDAFGRVTTQNLSFYVSPYLLPKGKLNYTGGAGYARRDFGILSNSYDTSPFAYGSVQYGLRSSVTLEASFEADADLRNVAVSSAFAIGRLGVVRLAQSRSQYFGKNGTMTGVGYQWSDSRFAVSYEQQRHTADYWDIARINGAAAAALTRTATLGMNVSRRLNISAIYIEQKPQLVGSMALHNANGNIGWTSIRGWSYGLRFTKDFDNRSVDSVGASVLIPLGAGHRRSAGIDFNRRRDRSTDYNVFASQALLESQSMGWDVRVGHNDVFSASAEVLARTDYSDIRSAYSRFGDTSAYLATATGSLLIAGGDAFASRQIRDSFAVVSTGGIAGIPVFLENQFRGKTNRRGKLLLNSLQPYMANRISIDPRQLEADVIVTTVSKSANPKEHSGVKVTFELQHNDGAILRILDEEGSPLEEGTVIWTGKSSVPVIVAEDGTAYIENLSRRNALRVDAASGSCNVTFAFTPVRNGELPLLENLTCHRDVSTAKR